MHGVNQFETFLVSTSLSAKFKLPTGISFRQVVSPLHISELTKLHQADLQKFLLL